MIADKDSLQSLPPVATVNIKLQSERDVIQLDTILSNINHNQNESVLIYRYSSTEYNHFTLLQPRLSLLTPIAWFYTRLYNSSIFSFQFLFTTTSSYTSFQASKFHISSLPLGLILHHLSAQVHLLFTTLKLILSTV